jgi:hypothetical protein
MARILNDNPAFKLALEAADHQCQGEITRGRGQAKTTEQCVHTDRGGWRLLFVLDDTRGALILCEPCYAKLQAPTTRRAARTVMPGQESLFDLPEGEL